MLDQQIRVLHMKDNLRAPEVARAKPLRSRGEKLLLESDRTSWAWEFLRRNSDYRAIAAKVPASTVRAVSDLTVINVPDCAPEVSAFGLCFR